MQKKVDIFWLFRENDRIFNFDSEIINFSLINLYTRINP